MFNAKIYIVWRTSRGGKDIIAIFAEKVEAMHNASIWKKEAEELGYNWNYKITTHDIYGSEYPVICVN